MRPVILSIETATLAGSICLSRGEEFLAGASGHPQVSHSNTLLAEIDAVLSGAKIALPEVDLFAVAIGPGSFTGLRIGIATVKALAETLHRPCVGIPTLAAVAHAAGESERTIAVLPAGRGELFAQSFSVDSEGAVTELDRAVHLSPSRLLDKYAGVRDLLIAGDGLRVQLQRFNEWTMQHGVDFRIASSSKSGWRFCLDETMLASAVAVLALRRFKVNALDQPNALQAIYVRPSDAELNLPKRDQS